jgi:GT2 family glycosyltransferase
MEVLIADGMSSDATRDVIARTIRNRSDIHVVVLDNPGRIVPTGMNVALRSARGQLIIRVDGHTIVAPNYVSECVSALLRTCADNVGGRMCPIGEGRFGKAVAVATSSPFGVGGARFHYSKKEEWVDTVYLGAWRREVFDRIGTFDPEMVRNQDDEFNYRLLANGGKILLSPKIRSQYLNRGTPKSLWKQYYQYGFWKVAVLQKHPRQMRPRQFLPPAFVAVLLGSGLMAPFARWPRAVLAIVAGSYTAANGAASIWASLNHGLQYLPILPFVYGTLHLGYGLGFLVGLIHFRRRWRL